MLYFCDAGTYTNEQFRLHLSALPLWRREKVERLRHAEDQRMHTLAFVLLEYALREEFGFSPDVFSYTAYGKPYLENENVFFSLSHTSGAVACAVERHEIGVDIERIQPPRKAMRRAFCSEEIKAVQAAKDPSIAFTTLWTEKEAIAKFEGRGLGMPLREIKTDAYLMIGATFPSYAVTACYGRAGEAFTAPKLKSICPSDL